MCSDLEAEMVELAAKGVRFASPVENQGVGRVTSIEVPGAGTIGLYEPRHATAFDLDD